MSDLNEQFFKFVGLDEGEEDFDKVKDAFGKKFVAIDSLGERKDLLDKHFAKTKGEIETDTRRTWKSQGVQFEDGETKGKDAIEINAIGSAKLKIIREAEVEDLKSQIGKTDDKLAKEWETKFNDQVTDNGQLKTKLADVTTEFTDYKVTSVKETLKKDHTRAVDSLWGSVDFSDKADKMKKRGFRAVIDDEFEFKLIDGTQELEARNRKTGEKVMNDKKAGEFYNPQELIQMKAIEAELLNVAPTTKTPKQQQKPVITQHQQPEAKTRVMHPNAGATA